MKISTNTIGLLVFTAAATAAFVWMAMRPAVEGTAMSFGMSAQSTSTADTNTTEAIVVPPVEPEEGAAQSDSAETTTTDALANNEDKSTEEAPKIDAATDPVSTDSTAPSTDAGSSTATTEITPPTTTDAPEN